MAKEYWYFLAGMLAVALPLAALLAIKKLDLLGDRPDARIVYATAGDTQLTLHAFHPRGLNRTSPAPALLLFHGGGWRFGSPQQFYPQCRAFAALGYRCFSAAYRLSPHDPPDLRGAIDDAARALQYLHDHAVELGVDVARIVAGGGSAGGHLAASLGAGLHGQQHPRPRALLLLNPVLDFAPCTPFHHLAGADWHAVSPLQAVDARFPPALLQSGSLDVEVPPAAVHAFCDTVNAAGGDCRTQIYDGQRHGFFNAENRGGEYLRRSNAAMADFLRDLGLQASPLAGPVSH